MCLGGQAIALSLSEALDQHSKDSAMEWLLKFNARGEAFGQTHASIHLAAPEPLTIILLFLLRSCWTLHDCNSGASESPEGRAAHFSSFAAM